MQIIIVGAGIIGICTALELTREGNEVMVIDAASSAASHASYANAGLLSPGHCCSWAEPGIVRGVASAFLKGLDRPRIGRPYSPALITWLMRFSRQSSPENWKKNSLQALHLARLSRDIQFGSGEISPESYDGARNGLLYLYKEDEHPSEAELDLLRFASEPFSLVRRDAMQVLEPALRNPECEVFASATFCEMDGYGDARLYARDGVKALLGRGVEFHWNTQVIELVNKGGRLIGVKTSNGFLSCDVCVVAAGYASKSLLHPLGHDLQIHPVSGYSLTYDGVQGPRPQYGGVSISDKIAWAPFGTNRMRFTGFADIGQPSEALRAKRFSALESFARKLCPGVRNMQAEHWVGQRPMTPDGLPYLGSGRHKGLYLNCGHGAMGWTMARASARLTAEAISGKPPSLSLEAFRHDRPFH